MSENKNPEVYRDPNWWIDKHKDNIEPWHVAEVNPGLLRHLETLTRGQVQGVSLPMQKVNRFLRHECVNSELSLGYHIEAEC